MYIFTVCYFLKIREKNKYLENICNIMSLKRNVPNKIPMNPCQGLSFQKKPQVFNNVYSENPSLPNLRHYHEIDEK